MQTQINKMNTVGKAPCELVDKPTIYSLVENIKDTQARLEKTYEDLCGRISLVIAPTPSCPTGKGECLPEGSPLYRELNELHERMLKLNNNLHDLLVNIDL